MFTPITAGLLNKLALTRRERLKACLEIDAPEPLPALCTLALDPPYNGDSECLVVDGLFQHIHGASLHRLHSYRQLATPSDEND